MSEKDTIHLAADLSFLHTDFLWRMPGSWAGYPYYSSSEFYEEIAKTAERGRIDLLFLVIPAAPRRILGDHMMQW